jgi:hypothetical protein
VRRNGTDVLVSYTGTESIEFEQRAGWAKNQSQIISPGHE